MLWKWPNGTFLTNYYSLGLEIAIFHLTDGISIAQLNASKEIKNYAKQKKVIKD